MLSYLSLPFMLELTLFCKLKSVCRQDIYPFQFFFLFFLTFNPHHLLLSIPVPPQLPFSKSQTPVNSSMVDQLQAHIIEAAGSAPYVIGLTRVASVHVQIKTLVRTALFKKNKEQRQPLFFTFFHIINHTQSRTYCVCKNNFCSKH